MHNRFEANGFQIYVFVHKVSQPHLPVVVGENVVVSYCGIKKVVTVLGIEWPKHANILDGLDNGFAFIKVRKETAASDPHK